jgi:hypothetical protein
MPDERLFFIAVNGKAHQSRLDLETDIDVSAVDSPPKLGSKFL